VRVDETFRPGIRCYDSKHIVMLVIAVILIITVVFGLPLLTISLLRSVRSNVRFSDTNFWRRYAMTYILFDNRQSVCVDFGGIMPSCSSMVFACEPQIPLVRSFHGSVAGGSPVHSNHRITQ
jgi:hypothetical protein